MQKIPTRYQRWEKRQINRQRWSRVVNFKFGFGKKEIVKAATGAGVAGSGAVLASAFNEVGILPDSLMQAPYGPYVVAALAVGVNVVRQYIKDNNLDGGS